MLVQPMITNAASYLFPVLPLIRISIIGPVAIPQLNSL